VNVEAHGRFLPDAPWDDKKALQKVGDRWEQIQVSIAREFGRRRSSAFVTEMQSWRPRRTTRFVGDLLILTTIDLGANLLAIRTGFVKVRILSFVMG
jgi:hypothetical protein